MGARRRLDPDDAVAVQMAAEHLATAAEEERWRDVYRFASQIARLLETHDGARSAPASP